MRNHDEFLKLVARYNDECNLVCHSSSLEELEDRYTNSDSTLAEIINFVEMNCSPEELEAMIRDVDALVIKTWLRFGGIPNWDDSYIVKDQYPIYENYFQRYGCFGIDCIVSWDDTNIVVTDGSTTQMVPRPDVLMRPIS